MNNSAVSDEMYDPQIGRFMRPDPLYEKQLSYADLLGFPWHLRLELIVVVLIFCSCTGGSVGSPINRHI